MADDDLSQREKRAQRHQQNRRKDRPANLKRGLRSSMPVIVIVLVVGAAGAGIYFLGKGGQDCPDPHWHATFGLFLQDAEGAPVKVDFASPRASRNAALHYYDYNSMGQGGDSQFSPTMHMHQTGEETGSAALGPAQWHMEQSGKCISVKTGLNVIEVDASEDSLRLWGAHEQVPGQFGTFEANETMQLRWWVQTDDGCNQWGWHERSWSELRGYQLKDRESFMGAYGNFTDEQITSMQAQIPVPTSRVPERCDPTPAPTPTPAVDTAITTQDNSTAGNGTA